MTGRHEAEATDFWVLGSGLQRGRRTKGGRRTDLLIAALAISLSILAFTAAAEQIGFERERAVRAAAERNDDRALMLQQFVSRMLETTNVAALNIEQLHALRALPTRSAGEPGKIEGWIAHHPAFLGLSVFDEAGNVVASTLDGAAREPNAAADPTFAVHRNGDAGRLIVGRPARSPLFGRDTIRLSRRLNHPGGRFAGVVTIYLEPAQLTAIFGESGVKPSEVAWVVGLDGIIRSRRTGDVVKSGDDVSNGQVFRLQRQVEQGRFAGPGTLDGKMRLVSHRRVPGYPLFVSYSILEEEVLRDARGRSVLLFVAAAIIAAATLLIAGLVIYALRVREKRALALAAAKARLEEAQRVARIGDWAYTVADNQVVWSPQLYEMYERDPALGPLMEEMHALLSERSVQCMQEAVGKLFETGTPASWEMEVRLPSGRVARHLVHAVPTRDEEGRIVGYHGTTQDVTELKRLEALQDDLAHLSRVGAMNALTATLAHELNQPLAAASNFLGAAQKLAARSEDPVAAEAAKLVAEGKRQVIRTGEIIQKMRNLVTKGSTTRAVVSVSALIEEALAIIAVTKACPYPIEVRGGDGDRLVRVDSVQIQQVLLNLVRNACEAQKDKDAPPPWIEMSEEADGKVVISVIDNGPGMPQQVLKKLFEPFMSSKQSGLGLGLSISRTIVEAHGGTMRARNRPEGGAAISFTLPLHGRDG
jgi:signal transduction histidine kinase